MSHLRRFLSFLMVSASLIAPFVEAAQAVESEEQILAYGYGDLSLPFVVKASEWDSTYIDTAIGYLKQQPEGFYIDPLVNFLSKCVETMDLDSKTIKKARMAIEDKVQSGVQLNREMYQNIGKSLKAIDRIEEERKSQGEDVLAGPILSKSGTPVERELRLLARTLPWSDLPPHPDDLWRARFRLLDREAISVLLRLLDVQNGHYRAQVVYMLGFAMDELNLDDAVREVIVQKIGAIYGTQKNDIVVSSAMQFLKDHPTRTAVEVLIPSLDDDRFGVVLVLVPIIVEHATKDQWDKVDGALVRARERFLKKGIPEIALRGIDSGLSKLRERRGRDSKESGSK